jgi:hypothetical protein
VPKHPRHRPSEGRDAGHCQSPMMAPFYPRARGLRQRRARH